jgi:hypothetical protein|tara:strand:- start:1558 stop:1893 length:336 start_codon:yes stop_codon:yes gene_type:complete
MESNGVDVALPVQCYLENDLEVDEEGVCNLVTLMYLGDEDDPIEVRVPFESVVELVMDTHREFGVDMYQSLYSIAHELARSAEDMRTVAGQMEDSLSAAEDLFDGDIRNVE